MSSSHSTVIYTSESDSDGPPFGIDLVPEYESDLSEASHSPEHAPPSPACAPNSPEYAPPSNEDLELAEAHALPALVLLALLSPNYSTDSEPIEDDPQEADPEDDLEKDPSEEEEEELLALVTSTPAVPDPTLSSQEETEPFEEEEEVALTSPSPTSSSVTPFTLADTTTLVASPPIPLSSTRRDPTPKADMPSRKRARFSTPLHGFEIRESSAVAAAKQSGSTLVQGAIDRLVVALEETDEYLGTRYKHDSHEIVRGTDLPYYDSDRRAGVM
ncbi:hypothetical protein Tco_1522099 [Tanacetum coccineum]